MKLLITCIPERLHYPIGLALPKMDKHIVELPMFTDNYNLYELTAGVTALYEKAYNTIDKTIIENGNDEYEITWHVQSAVIA